MSYTLIEMNNIEELCYQIRDKKLKCCKLHER